MKNENKEEKIRLLPISRIWKTKKLEKEQTEEEIEAEKKSKEREEDPRSAELRKELFGNSDIPKDEYPEYEELRKIQRVDVSSNSEIIKELNINIKEVEEVCKEYKIFKTQYDFIKQTVVFFAEGYYEAITSAEIKFKEFLNNFDEQVKKLEAVVEDLQSELYSIRLNFKDTTKGITIDNKWLLQRLAPQLASTIADRVKNCPEISGDFRKKGKRSFYAHFREKRMLPFYRFLVNECSFKPADARRFIVGLTHCFDLKWKDFTEPYIKPDRYLKDNGFK
jgi:hypothetical protein